MVRNITSRPIHVGSTYDFAFLPTGRVFLAPREHDRRVRHAMEVGARGSNLDVDITGDGSLIVISRRHPDRTTTDGPALLPARLPHPPLGRGRRFGHVTASSAFPRPPTLAFAHAQQMGVNLRSSPCAGGDRSRERLIDASAVTLAGIAFRPDYRLPSGTTTSFWVAFHEACLDGQLGWRSSALSERSGASAAARVRRDPPGVEGPPALRRARHARRRLRGQRVDRQQRRAGPRVGPSWASRVATDRPQDFPPP